MRAERRAALAVLLAVVAFVAHAYGEATASVRIVEQTSFGTTFEVVVSEPEAVPVMVDTMPFVVLTVEGASYASVADGRPQLLRVPVLLAVPNGCATNVSVERLVTHYTTVGRVYPEQPAVSLNDTTAPFAFDRPFYDACSLYYPGAYFRPVNSGIWRDLQVLNLEVLPVQVNPALGTIRVADTVIVRVGYAGGSYPTQVADWMAPVYARCVDNFANLPLSLDSQDSTTGIKCMVFCDSSYAHSDSLAALRQWIQRRGYENTVIFGGWSAAGSDVTIRNAIRLEYLSHPDPVLRWVLLIGEAASPAQIVLHAYPDGGWDDNGTAYSDFYYSCLDGSDYYPEVGVARISPRNGSQCSLDTIIGKILSYQRNPPATNDWLTRMTFVASKKDSPPLTFRYVIDSIMHMPYYRYWDPGDDKSFINGFIEGEDNDDVTNALNAGTGFLLYAGHGLSDRWQWWNKTIGHTNWECSDIDALQKRDMTPVVFNVACLCGKVNGTGSDTECLAEAWVRKAHGGAVASFGATGVVYNPAVSQCSSLVRALYDYDTVAGQYYAPTFDLGSVKMFSDGYFMADGSGGSANGVVTLLRSLMLGDPTMPIWIGGMPETATVAGLPDSFPVGMNTVCSLTVALKESNTPVEGALACICGGGEYAVGRTDADGHVSLAVHITDTTQVSVVVSEGHTHHSQAGMSHIPILPFIRGLPEIPPTPGWFEKAQMPYPPSNKAIKDGGWLTTDSTLGLIFAAKGNNKGDFYSYDPDGDSWTRKHDIEKGRDHKFPRQGCRGAADGNGHVFMVKGNNTRGFWKYFAQGDSWHQLPDVPLGPSGKKIKKGSDMVFVGSGNSSYVYLLKGYKNDFYRFNVLADSWETLESPPGRHTWDLGSWLVFDGDHTIYAHKSKYRQLWRYDISSGLWNDTCRAGMPGNKKPGDGCCGAWYDGCIYALKGNNQQDLWRYDPVADTWTPLDMMPPVGSGGRTKLVKAGADIVALPGLGLYATKGKKCNECWFYRPAPLGGLDAGVPTPGRSIVASDGPKLDGETPLTDGLEASNPRWNPQGNRVCYSKDDTLTDYEAIYQCYYALPIPEEKVTDMLEDCEEPVYSPSGVHIAFMVDDTVSDFYQLCVTTTSGGGGGGGGADEVPEEPADCTDAPGTTAAVAPAEADSAGPVAPSSGVALRTVWHVTSAEADHCYPEWSPNGQWLCYERDDVNNYTQIWRVPAFGGTEQQLTSGNSDHFLPSYLNSNEIVFTLSPNNGYDQIAKVNVSTHQVTVLSTFETDHDRPNPAANGNSVVAEALDDAGNTQIVKIPIWVGSESWLTSGTSDIMEPDYSQDNQSVFAVRWTGITSQIVCVDAQNGGYSSVTDSLAIRDNPDARLDAGGLTSSAVYEREACNAPDLLLGGGKRRPGSGIYLSKYRRHKSEDGLQGTSLGVFALDKAKPNPATNRATILWQVPVEAEVSLRIYNTAGQLVRVLADGLVKPGAYTSVWNGTDNQGRRLANGVYFYALDNGAKRISKKLVLTE